MAIESFHHKIYNSQEEVEKILNAENVTEHLCAISEEIFNQEREIGSGNFSHVYSDPGLGLCYKKMKQTRTATNNVHEEAKFLKELSGASPDVIVPMPVASFIAFLKREKDDRPVKQSVIAMQEIFGPSLEDIFEPKEGKQKKEVPETFVPEKFFADLKNFIKTMHTEYGIYHRDIASRNILIDAATGRPALIDFGDAINHVTLPDDIQDAYGRYITQGMTELPDKDLEAINDIEGLVLRSLTK